MYYFMGAYGIRVLNFMKFTALSKDEILVKKKYLCIEMGFQIALFKRSALTVYLMTQSRFWTRWVWER